MSILQTPMGHGCNSVPTRVVVAEDEVLLAQALPGLISKESRGGIHVVQTVTTRDQMFRVLRQENPDVLLCDVRMPNRAGDPPTPCDVSTLERLRRQNPHLGVLLVSGSVGMTLVTLLLNAGADGYLDKGVMPADVCYNIRLVSCGGRSAASRIAGSIASSSTNNTDSLRQKLMQGRRGDVLFLLLEGLSPLEIAAALSVGKKYVDKVIREIKTLTGANTHIRILRVCVELGIIKR